MFRGFRWQLVVLILATAVFLAGAVFRLSRPTSQLRTAAPTPTDIHFDNAGSEATADARPAATAVTAPTADNSVVPHTMPAYREGLIGAVGRLNPLFAHLNPVDGGISSLIFEGLFATNDYGEVMPRLAEQLVISSDGIEYVVRLREDLRWHDGRLFSADDVVYTMSLLSDSDYGGISPVGEFWSTVETQKLSDHLLRFRLAQPLSSFPHLLTIGILPEHALRGTTISQLARHPFNLSPIGTGPYQLAELRLGREQAINMVELVRSPVFLERHEAQGGYQLTRLSFHLFADVEAALAAFSSGAVNALANVAQRERLLALRRGRVYTQVAPAIVLLIFNWKEGRFAERRLRQALSLSLDAPALVQKHLGADVTFADSPYAPGASVYLPQAFWHSFDLAQARALLEAAGFAPNGDRETEADTDSAGDDASGAKFSLLIENSPPLRNLADDIATYWGQLGFQVEVESAGADDYQNRLATGRFQTAIVKLQIGGDLDLYRYWHPAQYGGGQNVGAAANHEVANLIEQARQEIYSIRRATLVQQLQRAFAEQAIAIPLYYPLFTFVVSDQIEGLQLGHLSSPADRFRGISDWRSTLETG